jgi:DNA-binding NarL/FixJ family response regulator
MVERHRILVLYSQSLFAQGLQRLLEKSGDFEVIGVDLDLQDAVTSLRANHPDAVLVDADDLNVGGKNLLVQVLSETPSVQLVCLTAVDGKVCLYRRELVPVTRSEDLLRALRAPGASTEPHPGTPA